MRMHSLRITAALCLISAVLISSSSAQNYPSRPIRMVVAAAAGGNLDITARLFAQKMSEALGQPVVVENRTGASGAVGVQAVARAPADGYTIGAIASALASVPSVLRNAGYDLVKDFTGIGIMSSVPLVLIVGKSIPAKSMQELVALAKEKPNQLPYASGGTGGTTHLPAALLLLRTGIEMLHVPYRGGNAPAYPDVISGRVTFIIDTVNTAVEMIKGGEVTGLGVTTSKRLPDLPDVPTFSETVAADYDMSLWTGLVVPANTPREIVQKLHEAYLRASAAPDLREQITRGGVQLTPSEKPEQFTAFIAQETSRFAKIVKDANIPVE